MPSEVRQFRQSTHCRSRRTRRFAEAVSRQSRSVSLRRQLRLCRDYGGATAGYLLRTANFGGAMHSRRWVCQDCAHQSWQTTPRTPHSHDCVKTAASPPQSGVDGASPHIHKRLCESTQRRHLSGADYALLRRAATIVLTICAKAPRQRRQTMPRYATQPRLCVR
jgi:hypothetical protein